MAATIHCVGCRQAPSQPFRSLHRWWSARYLVLKNTDGFEKYTQHVLCGTCQHTIFKHSRRSYDQDPGWDQRDSKKHAILGKWSKRLDQDFYRVLSREEHDLRETYDCQLEVSSWIVHAPAPLHSSQCQAFDGAPHASITGSGDDSDMKVDI